MNMLILELQNRLTDIGIDAALFNTSEITRSVNLRRLSGFSGSDASLIITRDDAHLFTDGRYRTQSHQECPDIRIHVTRNKVFSLARLINRLGLRAVGFEATRISFEFMNALSKKTVSTSMVSFRRNLLDDLRIRKSPDEVRTIKTAAELASNACMEIIGRGLLGRSESRVASDLESLFRERGAKGASFPTIVASGARSALPHGAATSKIIERGDLVIIDYGCNWQDYCSDETVTCIVDGSPTSAQKRMYDAVRQAHDNAINAVMPGVRARDIDRVARDAIDRAGLGANFLHSLGHGVGLEVHEAPYLSPKSNAKLTQGMVFTIEPGVYVEGVGGVRLESLVHLTDSGPEILKSASKELIHAY